MLNPWLAATLSGFLVFTVLYYLIALLVNIGAESFNVHRHRRLVGGLWGAHRRSHKLVGPSVDVFLPIRGEPLAVLRNTWIHVRNMVEHYKQVAGAGTQVRIYVLDDGGSHEVAAMVDHPDFRGAGFRYHARPVYQGDRTVFGPVRDWMFRGVNKKAGNLKYGYWVSKKEVDPGYREPGEFCLVLDADFAPRTDMILELVPYMVIDPDVGIVQSPQYFHIEDKEVQNWLERGAGSVQELFYRSIQQSRGQLGGAICVGTGALYRRLMLKGIGEGPSQIGHSEDLHTGFDGKRQGWKLVYVALALATGLCPSQLRAFVQQQYRWCLGSMSLLTARKFWTTEPLTDSEKAKAAQGHKIPRMGFRTRCCYLSGFCYYIHTAVFTFVGPMIPLVLLGFFPDEVRLENYLPIVPSVVYNFIVLPLWHRSPYGLAAWAVKVIYGWAHTFAIIDKLRGRELGWNSTGSNTKTGDWRVENVRWLIGGWGLLSGSLWAGMATYHMVTRNVADFAPNLFAALVYVAIIVRAISPTPEPKRRWRPRTPRHREAEV